MRMIVALLIAATLAAGAVELGAGGECADRRGRPPASVNALVPRLLGETHVPSVSLARIEGGRIAWAGAWGERRKGVPADVRTLYNVASLSKPISAETMLRSVSSGAVVLDEPMAGSWVDPDIADDLRHRLLTLRHVLTHRTGFPNWRSGKLSFQSDPGAKVGYSGEGFEYAARYTQRRTGETFEALAERLVFAPAGMRETAYTKRGWFGDRLAHPRAADGRWLDPVIRTSFVASDDLHTTATDYARFLVSAAARQGLGAGLGRERERVQSSVRDTICTPAREPVCPQEAGFGLGWDVMRFGEDVTLWHTGSDAGTFAVAFITPRTGEGIVILTNGDGGHKVVLPILEAAGVDRRIVAYVRAQVG
jgi:CubicO group peptidase (beta-lactamase class C family)